MSFAKAIFFLGGGGQNLMTQLQIPGKNVLASLVLPISYTRVINRTPVAGLPYTHAALRDTDRRRRLHRQLFGSLEGISNARQHLRGSLASPLEFTRKKFSVKC